MLSESSLKQLIVKTSLTFQYTSPLLIWDDQFVVGLMGSAQGQQANQSTNVTDKIKPFISFKRKLIEVKTGFKKILFSSKCIFYVKAQDILKSKVFP